MKSRLAASLLHFALGLATLAVAAPAFAMDLVLEVPEPGSLSLVVLAAGAAVLVWRNKRK